MAKVLQTANFVSPTSGGIRIVLDRLAHGYAAAGHEVVQVVPGTRPQTEQTPWGRRVSVPSLPVPGTGYRLMPYGKALAVAQAEGPDVLEVHDRSTLRGLGRWARTQGVPATVISHERLDRVMTHWLPDTRPMRHAIDKSNVWLADNFDTVVCTTEWAAEEFDNVDVPVRIVPLGVDHDRFRPGPSAEFRARFVAEDTALLVLTSRLSREKRPDLAVATTRELVGRGVRVALAVAGDGPRLRHLERQARGLPVVFLGYLTGGDLPALLATADVAIAPGPVETFGLAALEALASGTPVVCNAQSALPSVVGAAGVAADPNPGAFADGVEALLARPDTRRMARARAEHFDWDATVRGFLAVHGLVAQKVRVA